MGTGTLAYCHKCHKELEEYKLNSETGMCYECDEGIDDNVDNGFPPEDI